MTKESPHTSARALDDSPPGPEQMEMARLLGLINAEWRSDPMSVQCFDERIISDVRDVLAEHDARVARSNAEMERWKRSNR